MRWSVSFALAKGPILVMTSAMRHDISPRATVIFITLTSLLPESHRSGLSSIFIFDIVQYSLSCIAGFQGCLAGISEFERLQ